MGTSLLNLGDPFVRELWACILPSAFVILFCTTLIPVPECVQSVWKTVSNPFRNSLTLEEAEAYQAALENETGGPSYHASPIKPTTSSPRTVVLSGLALLQVLAWLGLGTYSFAVRAQNRDVTLSVVTAATWLYASLRPIIWSSETIFFDLFTLYLAHIVTGFIVLGGLFFDYNVYQFSLPSHTALVARVLNLSVPIVLITIVLNMPFAVPSPRINKDDIGKTVAPDDYCTLWDWISFHWVVPLLKKGTYKTLKEDDVWNLSPTLSSRPLSSLFKDLGHAHIVWKLWTTNSGDMIWDFLLTLIGVALNYAGPFFLQRILASIDDPTPENRAKAYIYALAAFLLTLVKVRHQHRTNTALHVMFC